MAREKKLEAPVTLFAAIETEQHEQLRLIAFRERRSLADVVREAIDEFLEKHTEDVKAARGISVRPKPAARASRQGRQLKIYEGGDQYVIRGGT